MKHLFALLLFAVVALGTPIEFIIEGDSLSALEPIPSVLAISTRQPIVAPLLTTAWKQKAPYNQYCPADTAGLSGHVPTGCVPLAIAMVMHYYESPAKGYGTATTSGHYGELTVNIGRFRPNWNSIDDMCKMIYYVGVSTNAHFGGTGFAGMYKNPRNTGTNMSAAGLPLYNHWNYQHNSRKIDRRSYSDDDWHELLQSELLAGHPIVYRGEGTGCHTFVIDGYDQEDGTPVYHVNWGAGGYWNDWYDLDDLTPGRYDFTGKQGMLTGCYPRPVYLIFPYDNAIKVPSLRTLFLWHNLGDNYALQVSEYPTFGQPLIEKTGLTSQVFYVYTLEPGKTYYWRIYTRGGKHEGWSRTHKFTTRSQ